jgi:hypothetical protein
MEILHALTGCDRIYFFNNLAGIFRSLLPPLLGGGWCYRLLISGMLHNLPINAIISGLSNGIILQIRILIIALLLPPQVALQTVAVADICNSKCVTSSDTSQYC